MSSPQHPDTLESALYALEKTEYRHFTVIPRTPVIGGVIEGGDFENMTDDFAEDLRDALWKFGVLFGLGRNLSFDAMKNVSLIFGDRLEEHSFAPTLKEQGHPELQSLSALNLTVKANWTLIFGTTMCRHVRSRISCQYCKLTLYRLAPTPCGQVQPPPMTFYPKG